MSESIDELQKVLELSLEALEEEKNAYIQIDTDLKSLMDLPQKTSTVSKSSQLVCIGCDLWVEMTVADAAAYFNRRIDANQANLRQISQKIQQSRLILENIQTLLEQPSKDETSEESTTDGLPIIDIQETLDDDGEVVSVTLNDKSIDISQSDAKSAKKATEASTSSNALEAVVGSRTAGDPEGEMSDSDQIEELLADMELVQKPTSTASNKAVIGEKEALSKQLDYQDSDVEDDDVCPAIRPEDVLELELIASELDPEDDEMDFNDEEEFDFELDDEDDEEEEAKADELLYGGNFGMFKGKTDLQNRLWGEVQALRNKNLNGNEPQISNDSKSKAKSKLVRFSENTEVKEIEDVSEDLKQIQHKKEKPLRFRERLIMSGKSEMRSPKIPKPIESDDVTTDIVDRSDLA